MTTTSATRFWIADETAANFDLCTWLEIQGAKKINPGATGGKIPRGNFSVGITDARRSTGTIVDEGVATARRHCEERSDAAIQGPRAAPGLLRFARNDGALARALQVSAAVNSRLDR